MTVQPLAETRELPLAEPSNPWLYLKVYFGPSGFRADEMVLNYVRPVVHELKKNGQIDRFFYIVYGEGAPHVRLRLQGRREVLDGPVREALEHPLPALFARLESLPLQPELWPAKVTKPYPAHEYDRYEPEEHVYGGPLAMPHAEEHFQDSSELAFEILDRHRSGELSKLTTALTLVNDLVEAFSWLPGSRADFYAQAANNWLSALPPAGQADARRYFERRYATFEHRLEDVLATPSRSPRALESLLRFWRESTSRTSAALLELEREGQLATPARYIVQSFIHMLHNRLGIPVNQEAFNLYVLSRRSAS